MRDEHIVFLSDNTTKYMYKEMADIPKTTENISFIDAGNLQKTS